MNRNNERTGDGSVAFTINLPRGAAGQMVAEELLNTDGAENYISQIYDTEKGDVIVTAQYVQGKTSVERLSEVKEKLQQFRSLATWAANSAGHGINDSQRAKGQALLELINSLEPIE
ncbi:hypothetical protein C121_52 [Stenotrophomonas phage C121]|uniref:hypothetical protein n=1 Tax=Stenotrophomonas phage C121 TaxID=2914029 RepID=UPI00232955D2|nr:hypothetical protein PP752_gp52 [Stenotrophomonas phage C121]UKL14785.1 hypothetical protein C121_52 [Stenotrophomonas phage C121]